MAMKTLHFKEHEGIFHSPIGQLSSVPWWSVFGSQSVNGEMCSLSKPVSVEQLTGEDHLAAAKQALSTEKATQKGKPALFTIFPGDSKASGDGEKSPQAVISLQTALPEYRAHFDLGFGQPMICAKYPLVDQCYGAFPAYGAQIPGRIMLPMNLTTDDGPIYVNAKQYHGIMRRRKSRAKAVLENKLTRNRKKPYMHYSRHLHAMRRPRGCGGRFLNSKELKDEKSRAEAIKVGSFHLSHPTVSESSEVLQSRSGISGSGSLNSPKEGNGGGSNISVTEVTSVYSRGDMERFSINLLGPPVHSISGIMNNGHGIVMPSKWVAAAAVAGGCSNQKV